ncbi:phage-related minor tail protein [Micromonospora sp. Llam0]|uniref:phage tail protein n=1 Tax=Micromonospora sp. Llam0 TaxID=2485143 RepID=UPI000F9A230A|nr:phage tail protein [Micromonospora sp. Llam0]ROO51468.1 phage-related minor tail protein [Micromonospora sp. Llam0]
MATLADLMVKIGVDADGVEKGTKAIKSTFSRTWQAVKKSAAIGAVAIGATLAVGIAGAMDLDRARAQLEARLGDPVLAAKVGDVAGEVYGRGFAASAADAMAATRAVLSSGLVPDGDAAKLEDLTVRTQAYATAWGVDVAAAAQYASTLIGSGLARDATHALDLITAASRRVPEALVPDVLEVADEYSQFFRSVGFTGEQTFALLTDAATKGKWGLDKTGDAIKEMTLLATEMSDSTKTAYESIGLDAHKMSNDLLAGGDRAQAAFQKIVGGLASIKDPTKQAEQAIALFGAPLEDLNKSDIPQFLQSMASVGDGLENVAGASDSAGAALEGSASQRLDNFRRKAELALVTTLADAVPYIEATFGWLQRNSDWVVPLATGLGILAAAIGIVVLAVKIWTAVQTAWGIVMATTLGPILLIIAGVALLVAAIVWIATQTTFFQDLWSVIWKAIVAVVKWAVDWIVTGWTWLFDTVITLAKLWWTVFSTVWITIGKFFIALFKTWWGIFSGFWKGVGRIAVAMWNEIQSRIDRFVAFFKGLPGKLSRAARGMFDGLKTAFRSALNWLIARWNNFSLTLGGGSVLGLDIPSVTLSTPNIPYLADGGIVPATPGGRLAVIGEGRYDEAVVPLPRGARDLDGGGGDTTVLFEGDGSRLMALLLEIIRELVRIKGRGNVQLAFGQRGAR